MLCLPLLPVPSGAEVQQLTLHSGAVTVVVHTTSSVGIAPLLWRTIHTRSQSLHPYAGRSAVLRVDGATELAGSTLLLL